MEISYNVSFIFCW